MSMSLSVSASHDLVSPAPDERHLSDAAPSREDAHVTLVVAARVASGVVVAADSRSMATAGSQTWGFDLAQKIFVVPDAPLAVAAYGTTRVGTEDVSALIRHVIGEGAASVRSPSGLACALEAELGSRRAGSLGFGLSAVVAGYEGDAAALWLVRCQPSGVVRSEILPGGGAGLWWGGTTDALDRLVHGRDARLRERLEAWGSEVADRSLSDGERTGLARVLSSVEYKVLWEAVPLGVAARVVRQLVETAVTYHALEGEIAPVGGPVAVAVIDGWSRSVVVQGQQGPGARS